MGAEGDCEDREEEEEEDKETEGVEDIEDLFGVDDNDDNDCLILDIAILTTVHQIGTVLLKLSG